MAGFFLSFMKQFFAGMRGGLAAACLMLMLLLAGSAARAQAPAWQSAVAIGSGNGGSMTVNSTAADSNGNLFITGYFSGTVSFGPYSLTSVNTKFDVFVAKWNTRTNSFAWVQQAGGPDDDIPSQLVVNGANVYIGGVFLGSSIGFGNLTLANSSADFEMFVAKLTDLGSSATFAWAQRMSGLEGENFKGLAVDGSSLYLVGSTRSPTLSFGNIVLTNTNPNYSDAFVAKITDSGSSSSFTWVQPIASASGFETATDVIVRGAAVYVTGYFQGTTLTCGATTLVNSSNSLTSDVFIVKLNDAGPTSSFAWAQQTGGPFNELPSALAISGTNLYLAGYFESMASFGTLSITSAGMQDAFVTKLTDAGSTSSFGWVQGVSGSNQEYLSGLAVAGSNVYIAGSFQSPTASIGSLTLTNTSPSTSDAFVAKLTDAGAGSSVAWALGAGGAGNDFVNTLDIIGTSVYASGVTSPPAVFGNLAIAGPAGSRLNFLAALTDPPLTATTSPALSGAAFSLAPNPARASTTVQLPALPGMATATLILLDALGRMVRTTTVALPPAGLRHEFSLAGLAPGLYALQVHVGDATSVRRLVVE